MTTADGCWADFRASLDSTHGRPCLFLDRDGVLIEDTGFPLDPAEVVLIPETIGAVAFAQRAGFVIGIVSNQSGIGRGYFDWSAFAAVQAVIDAALETAGARLDFVLACPFHPKAALVRFRAGHPWRKPQPGMLTAAHQRFGLDLERSIMLGDRPSDMEAAARAGVAHRLLLDPEAADEAANGARWIKRSDVLATIRALTADQAVPGVPASAGE